MRGTVAAVWRGPVSGQKPGCLAGEPRKRYFAAETPEAAGEHVFGHRLLLRFPEPEDGFCGNNKSDAGGLPRHDAGKEDDALELSDRVAPILDGRFRWFPFRFELMISTATAPAKNPAARIAECFSPSLWSPAGSRRGTGRRGGG